MSTDLARDFLITSGGRSKSPSILFCSGLIPSEADWTLGFVLGKVRFGSNLAIGGLPQSRRRSGCPDSPRKCRRSTSEG